MHLGIDVGSTYTKYAVLDNNKSILETKKIKTPSNQKEYFSSLLKNLNEKYNIESVISCGYGRNNVNGAGKVSELITLAKGVDAIDKNVHTVIDIGGQDSKVITTDKGKVIDFAINDKCAAGAGTYLKMALDRLDIKYEDLNYILNDFQNVIPMTTVCAVYAQTEIVARMAKGESREEIIKSAIDFILRQVKVLVLRMDIKDNVILSGGLSNCSNISKRLSKHLNRNVTNVKYSEYLSAIGCAVISIES